MAKEPEIRKLEKALAAAESRLIDETNLAAVEREIARLQEVVKKLRARRSGGGDPKIWNADA